MALLIVDCETAVGFGQLALHAVAPQIGQGDYH